MKPRIQLIILADDETNIDLIKNQDLSEFNKIDFLYWGNANKLWNENPGMFSTNFLLHEVHMDVPNHINQFFDKTCDYYLVSDCSPPSISLENLNEFPIKLHKYIESGNKLILINPNNNEYDYSGLVVNSKFHSYVFGFGKQTIMEKLDILAKNYGEEKAVFDSLEKFYEVCDGITGD